MMVDSNLRTGPKTARPPNPKFLYQDHVTRTFHRRTTGLGLEVSLQLQDPRTIPQGRVRCRAGSVSVQGIILDFYNTVTFTPKSLVLFVAPLARYQHEAVYQA